MAIRWPNPTGVVPAPSSGGWRQMVWNVTNSNATSAFVFQSNQPAALTRPGNLGTAYIGVWTGNISQE